MSNSNLDNRLENNYYNHSIEETEKILQTDLNMGLSQNEGSSRLEKYGKNLTSVSQESSIWKIIFDQLKNPLILILVLVSAIKSIGVIQEIQAGQFRPQSLVEILLVLAVVIISAWIGAKQEIEAEKSLSALRKQVVFNARVFRDGKIELIEASEVVPGDILILNSGDKIAADGRIFQSLEGRCDESILTGESEAVLKSTELIEGAEVIPGDQKNMVFSGTTIVSGDIKAIVTSTGLQTEFGKISSKVQTAEVEETKFQKQSKQLLKILSIASLITFVLLQFINIVLLRRDILGSIETGLALVIAFIPEALSAVTIIVLSLSATNLAKKGIIVKNLSSAEGMGSVDVFLTDKTGTITTGKMSVEKIWFYDTEMVTNELDGSDPTQKHLLEALKHCNNLKGPTEEAIVDFIRSKGYEVELDREFEHPYNSETKRMSVVKSTSDYKRIYTKGAGEIVLPFCTHFYDPKTHNITQISSYQRENIKNTIADYASKGFRVLLVAHKDLELEHIAKDRDTDEADLVFIGLICILDPLRPEVFHTVERFKKAGIKLVMITGDHPNIARYLSQMSGISTPESDLVITGLELEEYYKKATKTTSDNSQQINLELLSQKELEHISSCQTFARVSPKHKDFLVEIFKKQGHIVSMAGDGVNDAVAIKKANIGIAVKNAVDWVRDIAGIVVAGGFDSLANCIEEGRKIIYKARLFSHYLISGNTCQVGVFLLSSAFILPNPLTALQLLIINLLTDTFPALAMAYEDIKEDVMSQPPKPANEGLINKPIWISVILQGLISSLFLFGVFYWLYVNQGYSLAYSQTATFIAYLFQKLYRAFTARSLKESIFKLGFFTNRMTLISVAASILVGILVTTVFPSWLGMEQVSLQYILIIGLIALIAPIAEELIKIWNKKYYH
jgi:P-type Ca2+ transporter type 2C